MAKKTTIKGSVSAKERMTAQLYNVKFKHLIKPHLENVKKSAKANIKDRSGELAKSLEVKITDTKAGRVWGGVGVDTKAEGIYKGETVRPIKYAHLVEKEFNHRLGKVVKGKAFMARAVKANGGEKATRKIVKQALKEATKEAKWTEIKKL